MVSKLVHLVIAFSLCTSVVASESCAADDQTCNLDDATSLIQKSMAVAAPPPAKPAAAAAGGDEFPSDMGMLYMVLEDSFEAMDAVQLHNLKARQTRDDGCHYGTEPGKKGVCKAATDHVNNVFASNGMPAAAGKKSLLEIQGGFGRARSLIFSWEDHNDLAIHRRLRWERQRRALPPSSIHDLTTITDSHGMNVIPNEKGMSLLQEQFPLAVQLHFDEPAQCQTNNQGQMVPKSDVKSGADVNIDVSAMLTCQVTHAAQIVDDMTKELAGEEKTWTAAQATYKKANDDVLKFKKKLLTEVQDNSTKLEASLNAAYPCGPGVQAKAFFSKAIGKTDKDADLCISKRKVEADKNTKTNEAQMKAALAQINAKKTASHDALDAAKEAFSLFKKTLRDAKTQKYLIPVVKDMVSDKVMGPLSKVDSIMGANVAGPAQAASAIASEAGKKDANSIYDADAKTFYLMQKISGMISPPLNLEFSKGLGVVWDALNIAKEAVEEGLLTLVGSIPFVGGALAAVVAVVFDAVWILLQNAINAALVGLFDTLLNKIITAMVGPLMKNLNDPKAKADPKAIQAAAVKAKTDLTSAASKNIAQKAKEASAAAKGSQASTTDFLKQMSDDAKKDDSDKDNLLKTQYAADKSFLLEMRATVGRRMGRE